MHGAGLMQNVRTNLKHLHTYYKDKKKQFYSSKPVKTKYDFPEISTEKMEKIKKDIQIKIKKQKQEEVIWALALSLIVFAIIYFLFIF